METKETKQAKEATVFVAIKDEDVCDRFYSPFKKMELTKLEYRFNTILSCKKIILSAKLPKVLIFGLDLYKDASKSIKFCEEIKYLFPQLKILLVTSPADYNTYEKQIYELTSGFISTEAMPHVIVFAVEEIMKGKYYNYVDFKASVKNYDQEQEPELLNTTYLDMIDKIMTDNKIETIEKMSEFIRTAEKSRMNMINDLICREEEMLNKGIKEEYLNLLIDNLLLRGYSNWKIAAMLKINTDEVRSNRWKLMNKIRGDNSIGFILHDKAEIKLNDHELQLLQYVATGYTSKEIGKYFFFTSPDTVKKQRSVLLEKFSTDRAEEMVMKALKMGLIKVEGINELMTD